MRPPALTPQSPVPLTEKIVWSVDDVVRATGLSRRKVSELICSGALPSSRIGRRILLDPAAVKSALLGGGK